MSTQKEKMREESSLNEKASVAEHELSHVLLCGDEHDDLLLHIGNDEMLFGQEAFAYVTTVEDDVLRNDIYDLDIADVFADDADDVDMLLGSPEDLDSVKGMINKGLISVEIAILGDNISGQNADEVLQNVGAKDAVGNLDLTQWRNIGNENGFAEFAKDDIIILIEQSRLSHGSV